MNNICIAFWLQHFKVDTFTCQCPPVDKLCNCNTVSEVSKKIFNIFHTADELQMYHSSSIIDWSLLFNSTLLTREAMYGKTRFTKRLKSFYLPLTFLFPVSNCSAAKHTLLLPHAASGYTQHTLSLSPPPFIHTLSPSPPPFFCLPASLPGCLLFLLHSLSPPHYPPTVWTAAVSPQPPVFLLAASAGKGSPCGKKLSSPPLPPPTLPVW